MSDDDKEDEKPIVAKTAVDLQRLKLMKLMKNPEKPIILPERPKTKNTPTVPEFVRNVMGSSAGAGSGEFHVYRHLRRKEYARQKFIQEKGSKEHLDDEYHLKLEENRRMAEEITAKKRAKRLKKKQKWKQRKRMRSKNPEKCEKNVSSDTESSDPEEETEGKDNTLKVVPDSEIKGMETIESSQVPETEKSKCVESTDPEDEKSGNECKKPESTAEAVASENNDSVPVESESTESSKGQ